MVERLANIEEKLDILTDEIIGMKEEAKELRKSNEVLTNQISLLEENPDVSESFIKVSIS